MERVGAPKRPYPQLGGFFFAPIKTISVLHYRFDSDLPKLHIFNILRTTQKGSVMSEDSAGYPNNIPLVCMVHLPLPSGRNIYIGRENGESIRKSLNLDQRDKDISTSEHDVCIELTMDRKSLGFFTTSFLIGLFAPSIKKLGASLFARSYTLIDTTGEKLAPVAAWERIAHEVAIRVEREELCAVRS